jgi:hypothetical protein
MWPSCRWPAACSLLALREAPPEQEALDEALTREAERERVTS